MPPDTAEVERDIKVLGLGKRHESSSLYHVVTAEKLTIIFKIGKDQRATIPVRSIIGFGACDIFFPDLILGITG